MTDASKPTLSVRREFRYMMECKSSALKNFIKFEVQVDHAERSRQRTSGVLDADSSSLQKGS